MFDFNGCKNLEDENVVKEGKIELNFKILYFYRNQEIR